MSNVMLIKWFIDQEYKNVCDRKAELSVKETRLVSLLVADNSMSPEEFLKLNKQRDVIKELIHRLDIEAETLNKVKKIFAETVKMGSTRNNKSTNNRSTDKVMQTIEVFMLKNNMNLKQFAEKAKIPYTTLASKRSRKVTKHKASFINTVANVMDIDPNELMEGYYES